MTSGPARTTPGRTDENATRPSGTGAYSRPGAETRPATSAAQAGPAPSRADMERQAPGRADMDRPRSGDETSPFLRTSEFWVYLAAVAGVWIASWLVKAPDGSPPAADPFRADKAWFFITILSIGYILSRGIAKAGSRTRDIYERR